MTPEQIQNSDRETDDLKGTGIKLRSIPEISIVSISFNNGSEEHLPLKRKNVAGCEERPADVLKSKSNRNL